MTSRMMQNTIFLLQKQITRGINLCTNMLLFHGKHQDKAAFSNKNYTK